MPADYTSERQESFVDIGALVIPDAQAPELTQPGKRALDHPTPLSETTAVFRAAHGQQGQNVARPESPPNRLGVVDTVAQHAVGPTPRAPVWVPRTRLAQSNCSQPPETNQSDRGERANPASRSGSDPTRPPVASRADVANTSSQNRRPVLVATSAEGCRCEEQTEYRSDTLDHRLAAFHPSVVVVESAKRLDEIPQRIRKQRGGHVVHVSRPKRNRLLIPFVGEVLSHALNYPCWLT
jgi:hypothetical protein